MLQEFNALIKFLISSYFAQLLTERLLHQVSAQHCQYTQVLFVSTGKRDTYHKYEINLIVIPLNRVQQMQTGYKGFRNRIGFTMWNRNSKSHSS